MPIGSVALIFDNKTRPDTTGVYCRRALAQLANVEHFLPTELANIPRKGFDLYLHIDDGLEYSLPKELRPSAWWAIDTHLNMTSYLRKAQDFDFVFAAQRDGAAEFQRAGIASAHWLPLACDPDIHRQHAVDKMFDIAFVGNLLPGERTELVELIKKSFANSFVGQRYFEDMALIYSASRLVFNRSIRNDVNMRVFEALASGSMLLTNDLAANGQDELFRPGEHLDVYRDGEDFLHKARHYLRHAEAREKIAAAGRAQVLAKDTYRHRMSRVLREVEQRRTTIVPLGATRRPDADDSSSVPPARTRPSNRDVYLSMLDSSVQRILFVGGDNHPLAHHGVGNGTTEVFHARAVGDRDKVDGNDGAWCFVKDGKKQRGASGSFDAVLCGDDVLNESTDTVHLLRQLRHTLKPGGMLIVRIPNLRQHGRVRHLLEGNWSYGTEGFSPRQLRFFTRREIEKALYRAGFDLHKVAAVPDADYEDWLRQGRPRKITLGKLQVACLSEEEAEEFFASSYVLAARATPSPSHGLTSIVVITHNQLEYTRRCLDSVRQFTDEPFELICIDNGSTDGSVDYLRSLPDVKLITNAANVGFPKAANQGIRAAMGEQVLLLNNDTIVTTGWLKRQLAAFASDPHIGLVGPCSNFVSGPQQIETSYDRVADLDGFAWEWGKTNDGSRLETDRLVGFCLLLRKEVIDRVGLLDERFGIGCFEDDDICVRAAQAGYKLVNARDAFVHHFGGRTFIASGVDFQGLMEKNRDLFLEKWKPDHAPERQEQVVNPSATSPATTPPARSEFTLQSGGPSGLRLRKITLSLCMIVRDNTKTIDACLESIKPWVDEMIVIDTGSTDDTPARAARHGAKVFRFPWTDSFSEARNESLRHASGEWLFWMDSDDTIDEQNGRQLHDLAARAVSAQVLGYIMQVHCPGPPLPDQADVTVVDHVKMFRNLPHLTFEGRIHEQILPAIRQAGGDVAWTDIHVVHSGYDHSPPAQERKRQRDLRLLELELQERPDHPFTLFNLGMTYADCQEYQQAVEFLQRSIANSGETETHLRKAYSLLVYALGQLGHHDSAWDSCQKGLGLFPNDAELRFRKGLLLQHFGRCSEAEAAYEDLLHRQGDRYFASMDRGICGYKARQNLAVLYGDMGSWAKAEDQWRRVVDEAPGYRAGWRGLAETLQQQAKQADLLDLSAKLCDDDALKAESCLFQAQAHAMKQEWDQAKRKFQEAVSLAREDGFFVQALCRFLFEHGEPRETEKALKALVRLDPQDAAALHNLGSLYLKLGFAEAAESAYRESLRHRPDSAFTYRQLGVALRNGGRLPDAIVAWEKAALLGAKDADLSAWLEKAKQEISTPSAGSARAEEAVVAIG